MLWLSKRAKIKGGKRDFDSKVKFQLLRSMTSLVGSKAKIHSFTDFMLETLGGVSGEIVDTQVFLERGKLSGKIDVLRRTKDGYVIQEEKSSDPPSSNGVWPGDRLQVDAYAFLAEENPKYSPIVGGVVIYNDLVPRNVKPNPKRAEEILWNVTKLLENNVLPEAEGNVTKCRSCVYYPLCQVLPPKGGLADTQIRNLF